MLTGENEHSYAKAENGHSRVLRKNSSQPGILYSANISFKNEGETEPFTDRPEQRGLITGRPALYEKSQ